MKDYQIQAKEHNEANAKRQHDLAQSRENLQSPKSIDGRHEQCPAGAVKIAEGVFDCGDMIFVGDRL